MERKHYMYQNIASRFVELLQLPLQPVGLAFVEEVPSALQHVARLHQQQKALLTMDMGERV